MISDRDITFTFVAHKGPFGLFAALLALSLRQTYGIGVRIAVGLPEEHGENGGLEAKTLALFASLDITCMSITNPISAEYPIGNKLGCLKRASEIAVTPIIVLLDTDMLALVPLRLPNEDWDVAAKPADRAGRADRLSTWTTIFDLFRLPLPTARMRSTVDGEEMLPYYNAGFVAIRGHRGRDVATTWVETARAIRDAKHRDPQSIIIGDDRDPERRINQLDQFALPVAIARDGLKTFVLDETFNYPLPRRRRLPPDPVYFVHYHHGKAFFAEPRLAGYWSDAVTRFPMLAEIADKLGPTVKRQENLWKSAGASPAPGAPG